MFAHTIVQASVKVPTTGGTSQKIAVSSTSAQSAAFSDHTTCFLVNDVGVYLRQGSNPTALNDGTDVYLPAGSWRLVDIIDENKLAFICAAGVTGNVWLTQGV